MGAYDYFTDFNSPHTNSAGGMNDDNSGAPPTDFPPGSPPPNTNAGPSVEPPGPNGEPDPFWNIPNNGSTGGGPSGSGIPDWLKKMFGDNGNGNLFGISPDIAGRGALVAGAYNDYKNSDKYMDLAGKYADQMDPFGKQRGYYQDRLRQLTEDPNKYLESSPDYQAALRQGLGAVDRSAAAKGIFGTGTGNADVMRFGSDLGAKYLDKDRQSLMNMAGSQFGPGAAGDLIKTGIEGSIESKNNALTNLFRAMFPEAASKNPTAKNNPNGNNNVDPALRDALKNAGLSPAQIASIFNNRYGGTQDPGGYHGGGMQGGQGNGDRGTGTNGGYSVDPATGDQYDKDGNKVGNIYGPGESDYPPYDPGYSDPGYDQGYYDP